MSLQPQLQADSRLFDRTAQKCAALIDELNGGLTNGMSHSEMEAHMLAASRDLARAAMQDAMDLASNDDRHLCVVGSDEVIRTHHKRSTRCLQTVVGPVAVTRETYAARGTSMLAPVDAALNLPAESFSHGVRRCVAEQAALVSFDASIKTVEKVGGIEISKRQAEEQTAAAAVDFDAFYAQRKHTPDLTDTADEILVLSMDGKGIVMLADSLRDKTRERAAAKPHKLDKRLSRGEKKDQKRMAQVAAVYTIARHERSAEDVVKPMRCVRDTAAKPPPKPHNKRVWASIEKPMVGVNSDVFDEALARDPDKQKKWVALVDGNKQQLGDILALAEFHEVEVTPIIDIVHVIQYLWLAARCFFLAGDTDVQAWVDAHLLKILQGQSTRVAAGIRRSATNRGLEPAKRRGADRCADYLLKYKPFLHYDTYLKAGMPIATGVIEGACRYLVKDRMDITGARWSTKGAEAVLRLRALHASGDLDEYWAYHQRCEYSRNHAAHYADGTPPELPPNPPGTAQYGHLRCVK